MEGGRYGFRTLIEGARVPGQAHRFYGEVCLSRGSGSARANCRLRGSTPPSADHPGYQAACPRCWPLEPFLPDKTDGPGLTNLEYAPLAEIMGRSPIAPEVFNCSAPDTGNMEVLAEFGTPEQRQQWLEPLLAGESRSCFSMTEPEVASSDATNIQTRAVRDGDTYVITGHKWFTSNAYHPNCRIAIVMAVTDPEAPPHRRATMILVPLDTPGLELVRSLPVFNYIGEGGHAEVRYNDVRVPVTHRLGEEGSGFVIAQARLGPG